MLEEIIREKLIKCIALYFYDLALEKNVCLILFTTALFSPALLYFISKMQVFYERRFQNIFSML